MSPALRRTLSTLLVVPVLATAACTGDSGSDADTPEDALAAAKERLDETPGVELRLSTDGLPEGVDGLVDATGTAPHAPAFEGEPKLIANSLTLDVPLVAVDGKVFAELPFTSTYREVEPADYTAPDPAQLMDPVDGISSWLTAATGLAEGDEVREGDAVLTTYTGTLPGGAVVGVIPSAEKSADFPATFRIDDEGLLRSVDVSGPFYGGNGEVDYRVEITEYDVEKDIARP